MRRRRTLAWFRVGSAALVIVAIVFQLAWLVNEGRFDPFRFFAFFTIQSNLLGVAVFLALVARGDRPRTPVTELFRGAAVVYLTVTFVVVIAFLSGEDVQLDLQWVDFVLHKFFPVVVVLDWLIDPPTVRLTWRTALAWLAYPLVWVTFTLVRGALDGWYPYPFLDPANGGYASVAISFVTILGFFLVIGGAVIALGNVRGRQSEIALPGALNHATISGRALVPLVERRAHDPRRTGTTRQDEPGTDRLALGAALVTVVLWASAFVGIRAVADGPLAGLHSRLAAYSSGRSRSERSY